MPQALFFVRIRLPSISPRLATVVVWAAVVALLLQVLDAIAAERALFADGANFFLGWYVAPSPLAVANDGKHIRLFVNALNQGPAILARVAGVTDMRTMRVLFGAGLYAVPLLILAWCVRLGARASDQRVALAMGAGAVAAIMPSQIFMLEQAITTMALAWMLLSYQLLEFPWRWYDRVLVAAGSVLLMYSHESALVVGTILAVLAVEASRRIGWREVPRRTLVVGAVGLIAALHVAWWTLTRPILGQTANFLGLWYMALPWALWHGVGRPSLFLMLVASVAILGAMPWPVPTSARRLRRAAAWCCAIGAVAVLAGALWPWLEPRAIEPRVQFDLRFLIPFVSAGFMALAGAWVLSGPDERAGKHTTLRFAIAVALLGSVSWQVANTRQWREFDKAVRTVLAESPAGEVDPTRVRERLESEGTPNAWRMQWEWAWGFLSLVRLDRPEVSAVIVPMSERESFRSPRTARDSLHLPWQLAIPPDGPYRLEPLVAGCMAGRCTLVSP